jgi:hypothetical protein
VNIYESRHPAAAAFECGGGGDGGIYLKEFDIRLTFSRFRNKRKTPEFPRPHPIVGLPHSEGAREEHKLIRRHIATPMPTLSQDPDLLSSLHLL